MDIHMATDIKTLYREVCMYEDFNCTIGFNLA